MPEPEDRDRLSHIDSNDYMRGIQRALRVKGVRNAPDKLAVDRVQPIVDALQAGYGIYEVQSFNANIALNSADTIVDVDMFNPLGNGPFPLGDQRNNFEREIRILFWHASITGFISNGDKWDCNHNFKHVRDGVTTQVKAIHHTTFQSRLDWYLPTATYDLDGTFQLFNGTNWNGFLPHNII